MDQQSAQEGGGPNGYHAGHEAAPGLVRALELDGTCQVALAGGCSWTMPFFLPCVAYVYPVHAFVIAPPPRPPLQLHALLGLHDEGCARLPPLPRYAAEWHPAAIGTPGMGLPLSLSLWPSGAILVISSG